MRQLAIWDLATRLFHWLLVASVGLGYLVSSGRPTGAVFLVHVSCGYLVLLLLLFRLVWGFVGGEHARFADFVRGPRAGLDYLKALAAGRAPRYLGHNPAGAAVILLMLALLALIVVTGLLAEGVTGGAGPLSPLVPLAAAKSVGSIHKLLGNAIIVLAGLHVVGVLGESLLHRENLVAAMITGRKRAESAAERNARPAPAWRAIGLVLVLGLLAAVMVLSTRLPPARPGTPAAAIAAGAAPVQR
ncbi:MAG TPA: cytochrome b/b6 domain-containing protein [Stellaceae bacterium]|nr:cytochrome b/b6 domain-containing protein [Stellaceae bacterium]